MMTLRLFTHATLMPDEYEYYSAILRPCGACFGAERGEIRFTQMKR